MVIITGLSDFFLNPLNQIQRGTSYPAVRDSDVFDQFISLSSIDEQVKIIEEIESRLSIDDKVESIINAELKCAERLRQSILKQVFSGKLVPQDPKDEPASVLLERIKQEKAKNDNQRKSQKSNDNTEQMKLL